VDCPFCSGFSGAKNEEICPAAAGEEAMRCPHCGNFDDKVIESRTLANGEAIRRRRECNGCGFRFTSYERIEDKQFMVIKRDGRREPFDRIKIEKGVERAVEKRPVSRMSIESLVNGIEDSAAIQGKENHEIDASVIGDLVLEKLAALDQVAYIRFASVYRHFENLEEFMNEIQKIGGRACD
jgi:transcriptional repressor NrdR